MVGVTKGVKKAAAALAGRITEPDAVKRLGQALWMHVGETIEPNSLLWCRGVLGADGEQILWNSLLEAGAIKSPDNVLAPRELSDLLCGLLGVERIEPADPQIVWTLPAQVAADVEGEDGYCRAALAVIAGSRRVLWLVSPYLEAYGIGRLLESLLSALSRNVQVGLITHDVSSLSSIGSAAIEQLRRAAQSVPGKLTVYVVDDSLSLLIHSKLIVADSDVILLGSANLTEKGLGANLEAGVVLGANAAADALKKIQCLLNTGLVRRVFANGVS